MDSQVIRRYNAYYHGWCLAFGEHEAAYAEEQDINWLFGEDRVGLVLASRLRRLLFRELLGQHDRIPELTLADDAVKIKKFAYPLSDESSKAGMRFFKKFLRGGSGFHMFLSSHFCYPPGTRIVTFAKKKPLGIMYKEMQPMKLNIE
jgi:hypothetical protein